jgi:hypothetical protein
VNCEVDTASSAGRLELDIVTALFEAADGLLWECAVFLRSHPLASLKITSL